MTVPSCLALLANTGISLCVSPDWSGDTPPTPSPSLLLSSSSSSSPPFLEHWSFSPSLSLSLRSSLKRCGVFVRPDKGCHSSPFPLLCGLEAGGSCRSANGILSEGLSPRALEGPRSPPGLANYHPATPTPAPPPPQLSGLWIHGRHIPTTSTWPSFLLGGFDGWHPSLTPPSFILFLSLALLHHLSFSPSL